MFEVATSGITRMQQSGYRKLSVFDIKCYRRYKLLMHNFIIGAHRTLHKTQDKEKKTINISKLASDQP